METESLPLFTISNGRSLLKPTSENGHGQERESLLPGPGPLLPRVSADMASPRCVELYAGEASIQPQPPTRGFCQAHLKTSIIAGQVHLVLDGC